jgi:hypothetical protein
MGMDFNVENLVTGSRLRDFQDYAVKMGPFGRITSRVNVPTLR